MKPSALQKAVKPLGDHQAALIQNHPDQLSVGHLDRLSRSQNLVLPRAIGFDHQDDPVNLGRHESCFV